MPPHGRHGKRVVAKTDRQSGQGRSGGAHVRNVALTTSTQRPAQNLEPRRIAVRTRPRDAPIRPRAHPLDLSTPEPARVRQVRAGLPQGFPHVPPP
jgi:hypothetical protein